MAKAKLSQVATTWVDEDMPKGKMASQKKGGRVAVKQLKKKQTFSLRTDTIKRLWMHRVRTEKTLSQILDELVVTHLPAVHLDKKGK